VEGLKGSQPSITKNMIEYAVMVEKNQQNLLKRDLVQKEGHGLYRWKGTFIQATKALDEKGQKEYAEDVQKILTLIEPWKVGEAHDFTTVAHHKNTPFGFSSDYLRGMAKGKLKGVLSVNSAVTCAEIIACVRLVRLK